jgi:hypothetical protein
MSVAHSPHRLPCDAAELLVGCCALHSGSSTPWSSRRGFDEGDRGASSVTRPADAHARRMGPRPRHDIPR